jgi:hypothetical protein
MPRQVLYQILDTDRYCIRYWIQTSIVSGTRYRQVLYQVVYAGYTSFRKVEKFVP